MVSILLYISLGFMLLGITLSMIRFIKGPLSVDRVISFDVMTVGSLGLIALIAFFTNRIIYIDVALVYGLLSFIGVLIVARYLERGL
ncbi:MAG: cation:proton antiporter [Bacteroidetes bacterium]|nr:MAG: cation:proton antiporter [Bacteroidota bacterium]